MPLEKILDLGIKLGLGFGIIGFPIALSSNFFDEDIKNYLLISGVSLLTLGAYLTVSSAIIKDYILRKKE